VLRKCEVELGDRGFSLYLFSFLEGWEYELRETCTLPLSFLVFPFRGAGHRDDGALVQCNNVEMRDCSQSESGCEYAFIEVS